MKLSKREIVLAIATTVSLLSVIISVVYIVNLRHTVADKTSTQTATNTALVTQENEFSKQASYTDTVCAEYRKLYSAYKDLLAQNPPANGIGYAQPGAAKGEVDECYRLQ